MSDLSDEEIQALAHEAERGYDPEKLRPRKRKVPPEQATCPVCQAAPGHSCVRYARDEDGEPYIAERLKTCHTARRHT